MCRMMYRSTSPVLVLASALLEGEIYDALNELEEQLGQKQPEPENREQPAGIIDPERKRLS